MGGSFAEATCAALVIGNTIGSTGDWDAMCFPIVVSAVGIIVCILCSFIATHIYPVRNEGGVETALKMRLISTTILMIPAVFLSAAAFLPEKFSINATVGDAIINLTPDEAAICV